MRMATRLVLVASAVAALVLPVQAQRLRFDSVAAARREFSLTTGYGLNHRVLGGFSQDFSFDFLKLRYAHFSTHRTASGFELCVGNNLTQDDTLGISAVYAYRRNFLARGSTAVGYDLAFGGGYFTEYVGNQSSKANFTEQIGLTLSLATGPSSAFNVEYRFCHFSNAGLKKPNPGINTSTFSIGYAWFL